SFVKIGGHNILEPATHKIPVIYGPYMYHQKEMTKLMNESDGGFQVGVHNLAETLLGLLKDEERCRRAAEAAYQVAIRNRGSTHKTIEIIKKYL
ncbi:3-deoxy-D-manno-octulosonic acid transferase, partial [Candidatus Sumerlaeota bacterium]|nr:3-deoxy-D-manno-octulosonic acid transferase [Candidatus Sumerlaeota bacterium]